MLRFVNTDVENMNMNFTSNMHLYFDSSDNEDVINNSYERLLSKFKLEGKTNSFEVVDIQFHRLSSDRVFSYLNWIWWGYGYRRWRPVLWTIGLLLSLWLLNLAFWKQMHNAYPVIPKEATSHSTYRRAVLALIFTVFVFFSLRISLDKLKYDSLGFVIFFFFQYTLGLWCLFFIVRALLTF